MGLSHHIFSKLSRIAICSSVLIGAAEKKRLDENGADARRSIVNTPEPSLGSVGSNPIVIPRTVKFRPVALSRLALSDFSESESFDKPTSDSMSSELLAHYQPWMVRFPGIRSISAQ